MTLRYFISGGGAVPFGSHPCLATGGKLHESVRASQYESKALLAGRPKDYQNFVDQKVTPFVG